MPYERNPRGNWRGEDDYGRDYDGGRDTYSSARDYAAAGQYGDRGRYGGGRERADRDDYGARQDYRGGYGERSYGDRGYADRGYADRGYGERDAYSGGGRTFGRDRGGYDRDRGSYGRSQGLGGDRYGAPYQRQGGYGQGERGRGYSGQPQGYDYDDRDFFSRAGDEVRSWFGDDEAERRREMDRRYDERHGDASGDRDVHYSNWRRQRITELDRDYDEYRRENATKFENEFNSFRTERQTQRSALAKVEEHMEVVGADGEHVGTVDKVRGDRIILTKTDVDAGGRHHSIPSRWIDSVDDKVRIRKSATEAKNEWRDEERNQAMFGDDQRNASYGARREHNDTASTSTLRGGLNKSVTVDY